MTVVVTGASGHLGANLTRFLLAQGRRVRAVIHEDRRALEGLDVETVHGDIRDLDSLLHAFQGAETVYHAAGYISILLTEWQHLESINVRGTLNVVDACLQRGVSRLIHVSSIEAFADEPASVPVDETRPRAEGSRLLPYARSKAAGEKIVREGTAQGLDAVILNPTAVIGPHDYRRGATSEALIRLATGTLPSLVEGGFDWVDVRDVVQVAVCAETQAPHGAQYILSGHWVSLRDLAALMEEITGVPAPRLVAPMWLARLGAPFMTAFSQLTGQRALYTSASLMPLRSYRHVSHELASRDLDYQPRPFRETLLDTIRWFEEQGYLGKHRGVGGQHDGLRLL